jgi:hypothetical protein
MPEDAAEFPNVYGLYQMGGEAGHVGTVEILFHAVTAEGDAAEAIAFAEFIHKFEAGAVREAEIRENGVE